MNETKNDYTVIYLQLLLCIIFSETLGEPHTFLVRLVLGEVEVNPLHHSTTPLFAHEINSCVVMISTN
jgi:hypothetical protein